MNSFDIRIPGYTIHSAVGHGGMASVYLATQDSLNRKVAIKVLRNSSEAGIGERFINEARYIAGLNSPHVITIYDISQLESGDYYIAMEFVGGGDVTENLARLSTPRDILAMIRQVALALAVVHDNGIIHRDVKPTNILFRKDGTAVLTDFGIAKDVDSDSDLTQAGFSLGSPAYSSPEQAQCLPIDVTTDIYSLGVVLLELLVGQNPFKGDSHTSTAVNHIQQPVPALPAEFTYLAPLINRMLAKLPGERYQSCREMIADIEKILEMDDERGGELSSPRPSALSRLPGWIKGGLATLATSAALLAVYFGIFYQSETEREIERLLGQADLRMQAGHYLAPAGDNARDFYRQVLALDSTNLNAALGVKTAEQRQLDAYLTQGAQALQRGRLQRPEGENALHYFRQALQIDAANARAHAGIAQVIDEYIRLARAEIIDSDYRGAHYYVDSGLSIAPQNEVLLSLSTELKQKREQRQAQLQKAQQQKPQQQVTQKPKEKSRTVRTVIRNVLDKFRDTISGD
ncbi:serine/threonine-protein kinase [Microbulbifer marinus]|uniref:Serine/threonine protein kinase n=1 Tax=Microbulbifer marinus TaxID=658218 RepID=A0A1H3YJS9_9GAMM|nr:serine/threonine-protein kinase [Microbulbifer marinus]SEA11836.1 Serine/threonine protein kinase [Microbulbifer marinus]